MGETLVMLFRADVGAPFQRGDFGDFLFQSAKIIFDGGDLLLGGGVLELERDDVLELALARLHGIVGAVGYEDDARGEERAEQDGNQGLHGHDVFVVGGG